MDYILYGCQVVPGSDEIMTFFATQSEAETEALDLRTIAQENDPQEDLTGTAIYRYIIRSMTTTELVRVMNGEASVTDIAVVDRRLVALVAT